MPSHDRCEENRFIEHLATNPNVESGLHKIEQNPNRDPVVRELAIAVLSEFERAKRRRENRKIGTAIGFFLGFVFVAFLLLLKALKASRH